MFKKINTQSFIAVTAVILLVYFGYLLLFLRDAPVGVDDVYSINLFLNSFFISPSLERQFDLLLFPYRDHVISIAKLAALLVWKVNGEFNFVYYTLLGNLCFVGIALLLIIDSNKKLKISFNYYIPVLLLIFNAQYTQTAIWPMAVWSNGWVIFLAFASLYLLDQAKDNKTNVHFIASLLIAVLTTFCNGNGIVVFIAGAFILWSSKLNFRYSILWVGTFILCIVTFLSIASVKSSAPIKIQLATLLNPLAFLGAYFAILKHPTVQVVLTTVVGGIMIICFIVILYLRAIRRNSFTNSFLIACLIFILVTALGIGIQRADEKGLTGMYIGRYRHYSSIALCLYYLLLLHYKSIPKKKLFYSALLLSAPFWLLSYYIEYGYSKTHSVRTLSSYYNGIVNGRFLSENVQEDVFTAQILNTSDSINIYSMDDRKSLRNRYKRNATTADSVQLSIEYGLQADRNPKLCKNYALLDFPTILKSTDPEVNEYIVLLDGSNEYFIESSAKKSSIFKFLATGEYFKPGVQAQVPLCLYSKDKYIIEVWQIRGDGKIKKYSAGIVHMKR